VHLEPGRGHRDRRLDLEERALLEEGAEEPVQARARLEEGQARPEALRLGGDL
jgi:hypothetical protein